MLTLEDFKEQHDPTRPIQLYFAYVEVKQKNGSGYYANEIALMSLISDSFKHYKLLEKRTTKYPFIEKIEEVKEITDKVFEQFYDTQC